MLLVFGEYLPLSNEPINVKIAQSESALQPELNDLQIIIENVFNFLNIIYLVKTVSSIESFACITTFIIIVVLDQLLQ